MTLQRGIQVLTDLLGEGPQFPPDQRRKAVNLAIEAIERLQYLRLQGHPKAFALLPSETKD